MNPFPRGFTLTELLITLGLIAALSAIAVPAGLGIRRKAQQAACLSNLRQIGAGLEGYLQDHAQILPEWQAGRRSKTEDVPVMETALLPYVGSPEVFHCPADKTEHARSGSSYLWNTTQSGRHRAKLEFFGTGGDPRRVPLVTDKEAWHPGEPGVNFLYADSSVSGGVNFGVNE